MPGLVHGSARPFFMAGIRVLLVSSVFLVAACGGGGSGGGVASASPGASPGGASGGTSNNAGGDAVSRVVNATQNAATERNTPVDLKVDAGNGAKVEIVTAPTHGAAKVKPNHLITYMPKLKFTGKDQFVYKTTDTNGDVTILTMTMQVQCSQCGSSVPLTLSWNRSAQKVLGYLVYYGSSAGQTDTLATDLSVQSGLLDPSAPGVTFDSGPDLGLYAGDSVCFRIQAYNEAGFSSMSVPACVDRV